MWACKGFLRESWTMVATTWDTLLRTWLITGVSNVGGTDESPQELICVPPKGSVL